MIRLLAWTTAGLALALALAAAAGLQTAHAATAPDVSARRAAPDYPADSFYNVTTTADSGFGSLRWAIGMANASPDTSYILFDIPGSGLQTIQPATPFETIIYPTVIIGASQPSASCTAWPPTLTVEIDGSLAGSGANGLFFTGGQSTVRGLVINRFSGTGIFFGGLGTAGLYKAECNYIGVSADGAQDYGNGVDGIALGYTYSATIGGSLPSQRNLISGNGRHGISVFGGAGAGGTTHLILNNYIGVDALGVNSIGNGRAGVNLDEGSDRNEVGNTTGGGNLIAFNGTGVVVTTSTSFSNSIVGNSMFGNAGLGIDLGGNGVTPNDNGDVDGGPNQYQNFPALQTAQKTGITTTVSGAIDALPLSAYMIHFYAAAQCDASGYGEGARYLGARPVSSFSGGSTPFTAILTGAVSPGEFVVATATRSATTSEFSACVPVSAGFKIYLPVVTR